MLGTQCDDMRWGQWGGHIHTDENAYAYAKIHMEKADVVNVPAAALFSNTKYATLYYGMESTSSFSHTLTFSVPESSISIGYITSISTSHVFAVAPLKKAYIAKKYYIATTYDNDTEEIIYTGISGSKKIWLWGTLPTEEYIDPSSLTEGFIEFPVASGTFVQATFTETDSVTWSASAGVPFAVAFEAYGCYLNFDVTATVSSTIWVSYKIDRMDDSNPETLAFRVYTVGSPVDTESRKCGIEMHVWCMNGGGG